MKRPLLFQSIILCILLITVFVVSKISDRFNHDNHPILVDVQELKSIVYYSKKRHLTLNALEDWHGNYCTVKILKTEKPRFNLKQKSPTSSPTSQLSAQKVPDKENVPIKGNVFGKSPQTQPLKTQLDTKHPARKRATTKQRAEFFIGNKASNQLVEAFKHFSAIRKLGTLSQAQLDKFGLAHPHATLTLKGKKSYHFALGNQTYGQQSYYLLNKTNNVTYVIAARTIQDLRFAEFRLKEKKLTNFPLKDVRYVRIKKGTNKRAYYHINPQNLAHSYWSEQQKAKTGNDAFRQLTMQIQRLKVKEFFSLDRKPQNLRVFSEILFFGDKKAPLASITVYKEKDGKYFSQSNQSRVVTRIESTRAKAALELINKIF